MTEISFLKFFQFPRENIMWWDLLSLSPRVFFHAFLVTRWKQKCPSCHQFSHQSYAQPVLGTVGTLHKLLVQPGLGPQAQTGGRTWARSVLILQFPISTIFSRLFHSRPSSPLTSLLSLTLSYYSHLFWNTSKISQIPNSVVSSRKWNWTSNSNKGNSSTPLPLNLRLSDSRKSSRLMYSGS